MKSSRTAPLGVHCSDGAASYVGHIMNIADLPPPVFVTRLKDLHRTADTLSRETIVAVDTESNSLFAYQEQVCLIQFSTAGADFLVDPLALDNLDPLASLFADPEIEKVFHAAEYDLITLKRDFSFAFTNLFDTMAAARILGCDEVGLGSMLGAEFDVQLNKHYQRANWGQRPLPADMLDYARLDTHYLIPLRDRLKNRLIDKGRWQLAEEDFHRLQFVNGRDPADQPEACWRVSGSYDLKPQQAAVLAELCRYRDRVAKSINRPLFKVIGDSSLLSIAQFLPRNMNELHRVPKLSFKVARRHGEALLRAVRQGLQADPLYPPRTPRPDERYLGRLDALHNWRKQAAKEMRVGSDIVLPRDLLYAVAAKNPRTEVELAHILRQVPWRLQHFGVEIMRVLRRTP